MAVSRRLLARLLLLGLILTSRVAVAQGVFPDPFTAPTIPLVGLTVTKIGTGVGTVTAQGIDCGGTCAHPYNRNTTITITATPALGTTFTGWSGDCSGSSVCVLPMTAAKTVTASFTFTGWALAWTDNAGDETFQELERRTPCTSGTFGLIQTLGQNVTQAFDATALPSTQYEYRVRAGNANGPSSYSNLVCTP